MTEQMAYFSTSRAWKSAVSDPEVTQEDGVCALCP